VSVLSDAKPSVSREALKALRSKARYIALVDLEKLLASGADFYVRRNTLTLILHTDKWKKVPVLLEACADRDARIAEQAAKALKAWFFSYNRSFAEPTREDFQKISSALNRFQSNLPHGCDAEMRECLRSYFK